MNVMKQFNSLEISVLLQAMEELHAITQQQVNNPRLMFRLGGANSELEKGIIDKLEHLQQKYSATPNTIVLREV